MKPLNYLPLVHLWHPTTRTEINYKNSYYCKLIWDRVYFEVDWPIRSQINWTIFKQVGQILNVD